MTTNTHSTQSTKIRIALLPDPTGQFPLGETLWADPLPGLPGRYQLRNNSIYASLRLHDVVRTELDGCGMPQVAGIEELHRGPVSWIGYPDGLAVNEVVAIADSWLGLGSEYSEGNPGYLVTAWVETATPRSIREVIAATAPEWELLEVLTAQTRAEWIWQQIDPRIDRRTPDDIRREHDAVCDCESDRDDD